MDQFRAITEMTDRELIAQWHAMSGDGEDTPRVAAIADELVLRDIDFNGILNWESIGGPD